LPRPNRSIALLLHTALAASLHLCAQTSTPLPVPPDHVFGFRDFAPQAAIDARFLAVPDPALAGQHLKTLTAEPHWASSPEDYKTALYVADKFKAAGLATEIVPFRVLMNKPVKILVEAFDATGKTILSGPTPEHVDPTLNGGDTFQDDPRVLPAFNGSSPSGDVTGEVVYVNYGTLADFQHLEAAGISVKGKIVLVRYGANFRGVKVYIAQKYGAKGVLIYSDPADDGYVKGDIYPAGPMRPESAVQRGSTQFLPIYPGDPETPGVASTLDLPDSKRMTPDKLAFNQPSIPVNPLSYLDASPILRALSGPTTPRDWQGGLPFTYHIGGAPAVTAHLHLEQDTRLRIIWDVIGTIPGTGPDRDALVVAGNHRDAWVYGAVDPSSGTAAMLETVHGLGALLKSGWHPHRTILVASWDAEEEGLIGSTEWAELHAAQLDHAVAYFNTDVGVSGANFNAAAVPSLKPFVREVTREVPSPSGGTVYDHWLKSQTGSQSNIPAGSPSPASINPFNARSNSTVVDTDVHVGDLGSGSDYTPFLQHLGIPSTDIGSDGPYGVYHSVFDNYNWFVKNADPTFVYEQQQARIFGLEILHMADTDVLPYDFHLYGEEIVRYLDQTARSSSAHHLDLAPARAAAERFAAAGASVHVLQAAPPANPVALNDALRATERALLTPAGLPGRPWYKHTVYAPGEFTGYAAVVIPGVNEAIDAHDDTRAAAQLFALTEALNRAAGVLEAAAK
jgi:N-acetylated-alpha-linked acidic dipeptidase